MPPDGCRSEGTPSFSEGPDAWGETFGSFGAFVSGPYRRLPKGLAVRAKPPVAVTAEMDMYTRNSLVVCQAAIASRLAPTIGSVYIRQRQVVYKDAIAGKPAPTGI